MRLVSGGFGFYSATMSIHCAGLIQSKGEEMKDWDGGVQPSPAATHPASSAVTGHRSPRLRRRRTQKVMYPRLVRKYLPRTEKGSLAKRWLLALCAVVFLQICTEEGLEGERLPSFEASESHGLMSFVPDRRGASESCQLHPTLFWIPVQQQQQMKIQRYHAQEMFASSQVRRPHRDISNSSSYPSDLLTSLSYKWRSGLA